MANIYLRSTDGNDADDGSTWALAKATLQAAVTAAGDGGTVYMSDAHDEVATATLTLVGPTTLGAQVIVLSVDDAAEPPTTLSAGGRVATDTGAKNIIFNGYWYFHGVTIEANAAGTNNSTSIGVSNGVVIAGVVFENCHVKMTSTSTTSIITSSAFTAAGPTLSLINSDVTFNNASQGFSVSGSVQWRGGRLLGTTLTSTVFRPISARGSFYEIEGVDLQSPGASATLFANSGATVFTGRMVNCKLVSGVTIFQAPTTVAMEFTLVNCDSADTNYRFARGLFAGTETHETTVVRSGGASDGTTPFSRKIVTVSTAGVLNPYRTLPIERWNETVGSAITITVPVVTDGVTLTDAEAWLEVEYLGTSGFPLSLYTSDRIANPVIGTPANQTTDSSTWGGSLGSPVKQLLSVSVTPQEKGLIRARVFLGKASTTMYYDPLLQVS